MRKHKKGFTLIEITMALMIMAIGLMGLLALFPVGFDASKRAGEVTMSTLLAQEVIEEQKRLGFSTYLGLVAISDGQFSDPAYSNFEYAVTLNVVNGMTLAELTEVVVNVYWPGDQGGPGARSNQRSVELKTYIANYGP